MFGSLPSIFSITSRSAPVIQLARSHKSFNVRCFFSFSTKGQKHVSQMGLFSLPTNLHFSQTWNLKFYPNSNEIKSGQGSRKDVIRFPFFSSKCFPPKLPLKLDATFFFFILFLFEILNFDYQQFHKFSKRNKKRIFRAESRLKLSSFLSSFKIQNFPSNRCCDFLKM